MRIVSYSLAVVGVVATAALVALSSSSSQAGSTFLQVDETEFKFAQYISKFQKRYTTSEEFQFRKEQFLKNHVAMKQAVDENSTFTLGENQFSDWTPEEFRSILGYKKVVESEEVSIQIEPFEARSLEAVNIPESVDWRNSGAVTPVKDQGQCGSCWSFSTTGSLEGAYQIKNKNLLSFSEQQFVDCSISAGNLACMGGQMVAAMNWAKTNPIELEEDYKYNAKRGSCVQDASKGKVTVQTTVQVQANSSDALKNAIAIGPVSVAIEADTTVFQSYTSGIINSSRCGTTLDHGVLAVGYGTENSVDYYIVKNSWGPTWGENGFVRIAIVDG